MLVIAVKIAVVALFAACSLIGLQAFAIAQNQRCEERSPLRGRRWLSK